MESRPTRRGGLALAMLSLLLPTLQLPNANAGDALRVATFNVSLYRQANGALQREIAGGDNEQASKLAAMIQSVRPDVLLLNEIDYLPDDGVVKIFCEEYLAKSQAPGLKPMDYPHRFTAPVNTGVDSRRDLDRNGQRGEPTDAFGYGRYPGQYGMAVLSRFPIDRERARTFQKFLWADLPDANPPVNPDDGKPYYDAETWQVFRLSSKSHWDVPIKTDQGVLHLLASHPTPPAFDGPEDRNGHRNHDEIMFWNLYLTPRRSATFVDDAGGRGGLPRGEAFVIAGDLNADPSDGSGMRGAIQKLTGHRRVQDPQPTSVGGKAAAVREGGLNAEHRGDPSLDTAQFSASSVGNLRVDYCLPSRNLRCLDQGVFWPPHDAPEARYLDATDHRLVWVDVQFPPAANEGASSNR